MKSELSKAKKTIREKEKEISKLKNDLGTLKKSNEINKVEDKSTTSQNANQPT